MPSLKISNVGIARMPNLPASAWLSSTFTLPILSLPSYSSASSSRRGAIILHGPHHSAQKSTSTGVLALVTSVSKVASDNCDILAFAIRCALLDVAARRKVSGTEALILEKYHHRSDECDNGCSQCRQRNPGRHLTRDGPH